MAPELIAYHWAAGSLPPPYHDEYDILLKDGAGNMEYYAGYRGPDTQVHVYNFTPDPNLFTELTALLSDLSTHTWIASDPARIGGTQEWLRFGDRLEIPPDLQSPDDQLAADIFERIRALIPTSIWNNIRSIREKNQR
jgi:hypothetical protein